MSEPVVQAQGDLMCKAHGCPNRWTMRTQDGRLCRAHAAAPMNLWPRITAEQERRIDRLETPPEPFTVPGFGQPGKDGKEWARALRACELEHDGWLPTGRRMTRVMREQWRQVLRSEMQGVKP